MARFLIDANLPYRFSLWQGADYIHVFDFNDAWADSETWLYAQERELTIVTKDADFSTLAILNNPPPSVIHLRIGNLKLRDLHTFLQRVWPEVSRLSATHLGAEYFVIWQRILTRPIYQHIPLMSGQPDRKGAWSWHTRQSSFEA